MKKNGSLPGMGGVFNYVNLHVYHYAGNNPVKYTDPDGRESGYAYDENVGGFGHAGWFVKTETGYSFFEVAGLPKGVGAGSSYTPTDEKNEALVLSSGYLSLGNIILATVLGKPIRAGVLQRNFSTKEEMLEHISSSFNGNVNVYEFNTAEQEDRMIYNASIDKGRNFEQYALLGNNCGIIARDVLTTSGSGLARTNTFGFGQTYYENAPIAIGSELLMANLSRTTHYIIRK